jgi:predicted permease
MMWRKRTDDDFAREVEAHIELEADRLRSEGLSEADALAQARKTFGNPTRSKEQFYERNRWIWLEHIWQDIRHGSRSLARNPGLFAVATGSLALAIAAATAVFSVGDVLLVRALPVKNADQLRILAWVNKGDDAPVKNLSGYFGADDAGTGGRISGSFSWRAAQAFASDVREFADTGTFTPVQFTVTRNGASEYVKGSFVSGTFFRMLGANAAFGRPIQPEDDVAGKPKVAAISYRYWTSRFNGDPHAIGSVIYVNKAPVTITGVMPPSFNGIEPGRSQDLYVPMAAMTELEPDVSYSTTVPTTWWVQMMVRLHPGVEEQAASQSVQNVWRSVIAEYTDPKTTPKVTLSQGLRGLTVSSHHMATYIYVLSGLALSILLIACTNLANLLFARAMARARDTAVRLSLGASRARIMQQLGMEAMLIAVPGTVLGVLLAGPFVGVLTRWVGADEGSVPSMWSDPRALAFAALVCLGTALAASIIPGLRVSKVTKVSGHMRLTRTLIPVQVALSLLLLVATGLFGRTLLQLMSFDLGFRTDRILTFETDGSRIGYEGAQLANLYTTIQERIAVIPGVESVGMSHHALLQGYMTGDEATVVGRPLPPGVKRNTHILRVSETFLPTMDIRLMAGRPLPRDTRAPVAIVNEAFAKRHFGSDNPIGHRLTFDAPARKDKQIEIVGVVQNAVYSSIREGVPPTVYLPFNQHVNGLEQMNIVVRSALPTGQLSEAIRKAVASADGTLPVMNLRTYRDAVSKAMEVERMFAMLVSGFGFMAVALSAIGLYALMSWTVSKRTSEIGIRMALGARAHSVQLLVVRQSVLLTIIGIAAGVPLAYALSSYVTTMLYGVQPTDPFSFAGGIVGMAVVLAAAAWIPARRASRVNPLNALRIE